MDITDFLQQHGLRPSTWPMFADPAIWRFFGEGLRETLLLSIVSVGLSFAVGLLLALGRLSRRPWIRWPVIGFIEATRALPVLLRIV
jgi:glutamate transport system permease protein